MIKGTMKDTAIIKITGTSGTGKSPVGKSIKKYLEKNEITVTLFDMISPERYQDHVRYVLSDRYEDSVAILIEQSPGDLTISFGNRWFIGMDLVISAFSGTDLKESLRL